MLVFSLIVRFDPCLPCLIALHPQLPYQATRAYLHAEADIEAALASAGFKVTRKEMTATKFYFSRLFYAERL